MYKFLQLIFLLIFATTIKAQAHHSGKCRNSTEVVQPNFDQEKFAGDWYEIKATERLNPLMGIQKCIKYHYSGKREGVVQLIETKVNSLTKYVSHNEMTFIPTFPGAYDVEDGWNSAVVYTDYDNFAITRRCANVIGGGFLGYIEKSHVLARKKKLSPDEEKQLIEIIKNCKVPLKNLKDTTQDCD